MLVHASNHLFDFTLVYVTCCILFVQTANEFNMLYNEGLNRTSFAFTHVSTLAYDATWALAIALDRTARMVNLSETDVELMTS